MAHQSPSTRTISLVAAVLAHAGVSFGQSDDMLTARTIKNTLLVQIDEPAKTLRLTGNRSDTDLVKWEFATKEEKPYILVTDNTYNIHLRMVNPLKYKVVVDGHVYEDDPYQKTLNTLADNVQALLGIISRGSITNGTINSGDAFQEAVMFDAGKPTSTTKQVIDLTPAANGSAAFASTKGKAEVEGVSDYGIRRAVMLLRQISGSERGEIPEHDAMVQVVVDSVKAIESNASTDMIAQATRMVKRFVELDLSSEDAKSTIKELDELINAMRQRNNELVDKVSGLSRLSIPIEALAEKLSNRRIEEQKVFFEQMLNDLKRDAGFNAEVKRLVDEEKLPKEEAEQRVVWNWNWTPVDYRPFLDYQRSKAREFVELALEEFSDRMLQYAKQRRVLVANLQELMALVNKAKSEASTTAHGTELLHQETIPQGKAEVVSISVKKRDFKVSADYSVSVAETELLSHKLKFMRAHTFYPQLFPALVFVNSSYDVFTAEEDSTGVMRVSAETSNTGYLNVAGMVNFNIKTGKRAEVPFLQIGASAKRARPQLFLGAGVRFTDWFAISGGAAMSWTATLDKLAIGEHVSSQDALEKDFKYRMGDPVLYFGIQIRPSALTKKP